MKILITGGTGFIGKRLCQSLHKKGHCLTVLSRKPLHTNSLCRDNIEVINNLDKMLKEDQFDAIINLAGEGIADSRWSPDRKQQLSDSRIKTTAGLISFIERAQHKPDVLISASAIGFYGNSGDTLLEENSPTQDDFAHHLCAQWEAEANKAETFGVRVCIIRIGLVIGDDGGFIKRMVPAFKFAFGGRLGDGLQWMSWIHRTDLIAIIDLLLNSPALAGVFNGTSPNPVTNIEFTQCLAKNLNRPAFFSVPAFVLKILLGEMSELLLGGQRALPKHLEDVAFNFKFNTLNEALQDVLRL